MIEQGQVFQADFPNVGPHPVVVISRESLNRGHYVLVAVLTSSRFAVRKSLPSCVPIHAGRFGLTADCVVQCENILSIDKARLDLDRGLLGRLDDTTIREVVKAIGHVLDSECEPT
jgi:mRNA-degrading endonuclease toxin of MazEF toxin-antitoxin module